MKEDKAADPNYHKESLFSWGGVIRNRVAVSREAKKRWNKAKVTQESSRYFLAEPKHLKGDKK